MHSEIICFLDFLPFSLHKVTTSSKICCYIVLRSGWQCVSSTELGSSTRELPAVSRSAWAGTVEVSVNRLSLKHPINVTFTFSFLFFPKEKGSHGRDSDSVQEKNKLCGIWGDELCQYEKKIHAGMCFIIYIRPLSCNKLVKYNSIFHRVKYKEDRVLSGRFITWNWPYIYNKQITP